MSSKSFYSHGKLMLCGEYAVLQGATAFALPCIKGQHLKADHDPGSQESSIEWRALDKDGNAWFEAQIALPNFNILHSSDALVAIQLMRFLMNAKALNTRFLSESGKYTVETRLEFDPDDGLGSSSTLTYNIAKWAEVNPFELHFSAFKGSGFDVAIAQEAKPILYTMNGNNPVIETLNWNKSFRDKLFFVHLNVKQNSRNEIASYKGQMNHGQIAQISRISRLLSVNDDYFEFCLLLELAENEMSHALGVPPVKQSHFSDFHGTVKSLGAWGGDYVLATGDDTETYFRSKGYEKIIPFNDMILQ